MSREELKMPGLLRAGSRLGPYEILAPLGAGGMGEVYRARDTRLKRDVALKILTGAAIEDSGRFRRFQTEAQSTAALSHAHIVAVYDVGEENGQPYIVSELVSGGTLTSLLARGPLPVRRLLDLAIPISEGLAAAHAQGIVHRDLKPDNVLLTTDGSPKIADFGLAKYFLPSQDAEGSQLTTLTDDRTKEGTIVGTVSYMSPEQAKGEAVDFRSDQFSFGLLLYEMATGQRAFRRETAVQTLAAIVQEDPEPIGKLNPTLPAPLRWIIERCLAKEPRGRYASTEDLARELATVREHITEVSGSGAAALPVISAPARSLRFLAAVLLVVLAAVAAGLFAGKSVWKTAPPSFHRLTFRRGHVSGARLSSDGQTIVYSAAWDGKPLETFLMRRDSSESRSLGFPGAHLWGLSSGSEIALALSWKQDMPYAGVGTLSRVSIAGGAPREVLERVQLADWSPDGKSLAVLRRKQGKRLLEFPIGRTLYEPAGEPYSIRVSPKGELVAFIEGTPDGGASIALVDSARRKRTLSTGWFRAQGLAWSRKGDEVWFTASKSGHARALWAVSLSGRERLLTQVPGRLTLQDIAPDGSALLTHENVRREMVGLAPGESRERDLTWLGYSWPFGLSRDGRTLLFAESSEESPLNILYVRKTDASPPVRIGESAAVEVNGLSPDGRWAFARRPAPGGVRYELLPTGAGEPIPLAILGIGEPGDLKWFPDGEHLLVTGSAPGKKPRDYVVDLAGGQPRPVTPEGVSESVISPDGKSLIARDENRGLSIYSIEGGQPRRVVQEAPGDPMQWSADGKSVYLWHEGVFRRVDRLDLASRRTELWKEFQPTDPTGVLVVQPMLLAPDGKSYVYTYVRVLSDLYLVEGLK
jgi:Tol biopolymer transport system component